MSLSAMAGFNEVKWSSLLLANPNMNMLPSSSDGSSQDLPASGSESLAVHLYKKACDEPDWDIKPFPAPLNSPIAETPESENRYEDLDLKRPLLVLSKVVPVKCSFCPQMFLSTALKYKHESEAHGVRLRRTPGSALKVRRNHGWCDCVMCYRRPVIDSSKADLLKMKRKKYSRTTDNEVRKSSLEATEAKGNIFYMCNSCPNKYGRLQNLLSHTEQAHPEELHKKQIIRRFYKCKVCVMAFANEAAFYEHNKVTHPLRCTVCSAEFGEKCQFNVHRVQEHGLESVCPCRPCAAALRVPEIVLTRRSNDASNVLEETEEYYSDEAEEIQTSTSALEVSAPALSLISTEKCAPGLSKKSKETCAPALSLISEPESKSVKSSVKAFTNIKTDLPLKCPCCPMEFEGKRSYRKHLSAHSQTLHRCTQCVMEFNDEAMLAKHSAKDHPVPLAGTVPKIPDLYKSSKTASDLLAMGRVREPSKAVISPRSAPLRAPTASPLRSKNPDVCLLSELSPAEILKIISLDENMA